MFNKDVVKCFDQSDPRAALNEVQDKMMGYLSSLAGLVSGHMPAYQTMSIEALLTIDVHSRDIVSNMIGNDITKRDDFEWTKYVHSNLPIKYSSIFVGISKTCVKRPFSKRPKIGLQDKLYLNAGQKYCRMLPLEHSAILSTFIKLPLGVDLCFVYF